jgi:flagellar hook-associated protein 3 FlgL
MGMRVSTTGLFHSANRRLMDNLQKLYEVQEEVSSGKKLLRPGDNPAAFSRVMGYKSVQSAMEQYERNISSSRGYLAEAESSLQTVSNLLARAKELAMQGASGGLNAETLAGLTEEVSGIYDQVVSLANARYSGGGIEGARYLFSGFRSDSPAFTDAGVYQGDDGEYTVEVAAGESVTVGMSGDRVFQGDVDIFAVLQNLETALGAGDSDGVQATLDDLDRAIGQVSKHMAQIGGRVNRLDQTEARMDESWLTLETLVSDEEDLDLIQAASELTYYETVLEASVLSTQRIFQTLGIL